MKWVREQTQQQSTINRVLFICLTAYQIFENKT